MKTTLTADKVRLGLAVAPIGETAYRASLASMPRVNGYDLDTESLSLVLQEPLELGKAPRVKPPFGFATRGFDTRPNISEVFNHDSGASGYALQDRGGKNVVAIPSESLFTTSEVSKVPFSGLRTIGLQHASEAEGTLDNFLHVPITMEAVVRSNSWMGNAEVNPDSLPLGSKENIGQFDDNVEIEHSSAVDEVSRSRRTAHRILGIFRKIEQYFNSAMGGSKVYNASLPIQGESVQIITWGAQHRLGTPGSHSLLLSGDCRLHRFGSFLSGLDMQVRNEIRQSSLTVTVRQAMKSVGIAVVLFPSCPAHGIKRLGELFHCFVQGFSLFLHRLERYANRSIHIRIIPYANHNLQIFGKEV